MISVSRLLCEAIGPGDHLRYRKPDGAPLRPIVVWNCTQRCNLHCIHCYAQASAQGCPGELDTKQAKAFIHDLADFKVPAILFSGGEPLLREDIFELAGFAREKGLRTVISTNGTLITEKVAIQLARLGLAEVGISLDGSEPTNDRFRGQSGAYQTALRGFRNCKSQGLRVSLRLTITRFNYQDIPAIFDLVEQENIDRACFYHLAYVGRAGSLGMDSDLSHQQKRAVLDLICQRTLELYRRGLSKEILTVDNHADGIYIYLKLKKDDPERAARALELLRSNGGNGAGISIAAIDNLGNVHPDQFWWHYSLGNVLQRKFGDIWMDTSDPLLAGLKERKGLLKGRCARCRYIDLCRGNLRVRAEAVFGDVWAEDPACYLSDQEIGLLEPVKEAC
jgi:radical SAM protein with 4Fe4S-binding SPASM domain